MIDKAFRYKGLRHKTLGHKASITVEAVFVVPIVFFVILSILYLTFYLHDRCVIQSALNEMLNESENALLHPCIQNTEQTDYENINGYGALFPIRTNALAEQNKKVMEENVKETFMKKLEGRLWAGRIDGVNAALDWKKESASVSWSMPLPFSILPYFQGIGQKYELERGFSVACPAEYVRVFDSIHEVLGGIEGYRNVEERIAKLAGSGER